MFWCLLCCLIKQFYVFCGRRSLTVIFGAYLFDLLSWRREFIIQLSCCCTTYVGLLQVLPLTKAAGAFNFGDTFV